MFNTQKREKKEIDTILNNFPLITMKILRNVIIAKKRKCEAITSKIPMERRAYALVQNVLQNDVCHALSQVFKYQDYCNDTRNNKSIVCLPKIKTEYRRKGLLTVYAYKIVKR